MIEVNETEDGILSETSGQPFRYYVSESGVYLGATDGEPLSAIEVSESPISSDQIWLFPGWGESPSLIRRIENEWRDAELIIVAAQLEALEEAEAGEEPEDLLPGTRAQWLKYRGLVRNWVEGKGDYPAIEKRPVRPA